MAQERRVSEIEYIGWEPTERALEERILDLGKQVDELTDEVTRLRAFMPAQVLREYDRVHKGGK